MRYGPRLPCRQSAVATARDTQHQRRMDWLFLRGLAREHRHFGDFPARFSAEVAGSTPRAMDLPGFGTERARTSPAHIDAIVDDVRARHRIQNGTAWCSVVAISLGGLVAYNAYDHRCFAERNAAKKLLHDLQVGFADAITARSFDVAVECTGNPEGFAIALQSLRPRGTLVLKSTYAGRLSLDASALVVDEITLIGSRCGPFSEALKLLADHQVDVSALIQARYPLTDGLAAFDHAQQRGVLKVLVSMEAES